MLRSSRSPLSFLGERKLLKREVAPSFVNRLSDSSRINVVKHLSRCEKIQIRLQPSENRSFLESHHREEVLCHRRKEDRGGNSVKFRVLPLKNDTGGLV